MVDHPALLVHQVGDVRRCNAQLDEAAVERADGGLARAEHAQSSAQELAPIAGDRDRYNDDGRAVRPIAHGIGEGGALGAQQLLEVGTVRPILVQDLGTLRLGRRHETMVIKDYHAPIEHDHPVGGFAQSVRLGWRTACVDAERARQGRQIAGVLGHFTGHLPGGEANQLPILGDDQVGRAALIGIESHQRHGAQDDRCRDEGPGDDLGAQAAQADAAKQADPLRETQVLEPKPHLGLPRSVHRCFAAS